MANKTATVTARIAPEIKEQAEAILESMGMPVSVLIDTLYRQIIMTKRIPYAIGVKRPKTLEEMTEEEFNTMLETGYKQALEGDWMDIDDAFEMIDRGMI